MGILGFIELWRNTFDALGATRLAKSKKWLSRVINTRVRLPVMPRTICCAACSGVISSSPFTMRSCSSSRTHASRASSICATCNVRR